MSPNVFPREVLSSHCPPEECSLHSLPNDSMVLLVAVYGVRYKN